MARERFLELDFNKTYSPTAHPVSVLALIVLSMMKGYKMYTSDVSTAYLNTKMEKPVYMPVYPLKEFQCGKQLICLHHQLYGLKSAAKAWHKTLIAKIKLFGFTVVTNYECMFTLRSGDKVLHILIMVYDILQATNDEGIRQEFPAFLRTEYDMRDDCLLNSFLGVCFTWPSN